MRVEVLEGARGRLRPPRSADDPGCLDRRIATTGGQPVTTGVPELLLQWRGVGRNDMVLRRLIRQRRTHRRAGWRESVARVPGGVERAERLEGQGGF